MPHLHDRCTAVGLMLSSIATGSGGKRNKIERCDSMCSILRPRITQVLIQCQLCPQPRRVMYLTQRMDLCHHLVPQFPSAKAHHPRCIGTTLPLWAISRFPTRTVLVSSKAARDSDICLVKMWSETRHTNYPSTCSHSFNAASLTRSQKWSSMMYQNLSSSPKTVFSSSSLSLGSNAAVDAGTLMSWQIARSGRGDQNDWPSSILQCQDNLTCKIRQNPHLNFTRCKGYGRRVILSHVNWASCCAALAIRTLWRLIRKTSRMSRLRRC
jgi:hypothetical protein